MKTLINLNCVSSPIPKIVQTWRVSIASPTYIQIQSIKRAPSTSLAVKCSSETGENGASLKDLVSSMVGKGVDEILNKEENRELLDGLEKASLRVEMAKRELEDYDKREAEAAQLRTYVDHLEAKAAEIAETQREILEARSMIEEAERSLTEKMDGRSFRDGLEESGKDEIDRDAERLESFKAASISAAIGTVAGIPISLSQVTSNAELILPLAVTFISCFLFGATFRYAIRRDLDNIHLKTGTSAAFAFVKGLSMLEAGPRLELDSASFLSHAVDGAVYVSENMFIFVFAAVGLDFCFKARILSPFPIKKFVAKES